MKSYSEKSYQFPSLVIDNYFMNIFEKVNDTDLPSLTDGGLMPK